MSANWIAVASAEHVRYGREHGFMQACHGKDKLRSFTAFGKVHAGGDPCAFAMGGGFRLSCRNVAWLEACEAPIRPLLDRLEFSAGVSN